MSSRLSPPASRVRAMIAKLTVVTTAAAGLVVLGHAPAQASAADTVVPRVASWTPATGTFTLSATSRIVVDAATASSHTSGPDSPTTSRRTLSQVAAKLRTDIQTVTGRALTVVTGGTAATGDITLALSNNDTTLGVEGYRIAVGDQVAVSAPTSTGAFHATRSILQLLKTDAGNDNLTRGTVRDLPSLPYRAVSVDLGRRYWEVSAIQDVIRQLSWHKLNVLQLHFNESEAFRLYSADYAGIAPTDPNARYSQADIAAIEAVAAEHHVTVVPEIDMPAHSTAIALGGGTNRSMAPKCGSAHEWVLDYVDPAVRSWANTLLGEFVSWFSGPYFHIGNDEVPHTLASCPYVQNAINSDPAIANFEDLQERFITEQNAVVKAAGKRTMMWANAANILPEKEIILVNFGSDANAATLRDMGYDVVNTAYNTGSYTRFFLIPAAFGDTRHVAKGTIYGWTPATPGGRNLGQQVAIWSDQIYFGDTKYFTDELDARRAELAERTWNSTATTATYSQFMAKVAAAGAAPGVSTATPARTANGQPDHYYDFNENMPVTSATHFPAAYPYPTARDGVGGKHASSYSAEAPTFPAAGYRGSGARFTAGAKDKLNIAGSDLAPPWTVATWVRRETDGTDTQLLRGWNTAIKLEQYKTTNRVGVTTYGVGDYSFAYTVPLNQWTHLAFVASPTGTSLYANGSLVQTIPQTVALPRGAIGGDRAFGGTLDELRIYDEALTATQVAALHDSYGTDAALGGPATSSTVETPAFPASAAVDGIASTRWSSARTDPQWIRVDLGSVKAINRVKLTWEAAYGRDYQVQVSTDGTNFTTIGSQVGGDGGVDDLTGLSGSGRYLRIYGTARGTTYGYSLWSLEVGAA
ncbi:family 20 glycosylhydrolase [Actinokineospora xionganensis]|uniref:beta-N-acetylhexosaminidase n=1 Tax=Actinokineospora xionganensis TaxID=2684470 RepID=A0ABR7L3P1_9PSEU|nr:family 20 glycosylhydrolase [Actinokineospora xionganensis]MBC6447305.1 family 20 glycosylhydrolase [Actinokineospora xionganensis]